MDSATQLTPDALPIPRNLKNNFWYVRPSASTSVTIVFLHGIFSDSRSCWLYEGTDPQYPKAVFWPDLVRTDPRLGSPAIYLAGYYTEVDAGDFPIAQCAKQVMDALGLPDDDGIPAVLGSATLVFVCHSMGGIMARYLIERYKDVFRKKGVGLALIASPSLGSDWADIASLAAKYYNQRLAQQLKWRNDALEELHGRFKDLVDRRVTEMPGLFGMEAAETKMIYRSSLPAMIRHFVPNRNTIVDSLSAAQYFSSVTLLPDTDHFSIVKPYGFDHPAHQFLLTFMQHFGKTLAELRRLRIFGEPSSAGSGTDVPEAAFAAPSVQGAGTSAASLAAAAMSSVSQGTQVAIPPQPASRQSISPQLPQGVEATALAEGARTFAREGTPRPRLDELFEIVTNPDDVRGALYPLESATGLSPGAAAYTNARIGEDDIQQTLETALRASRGRLLVTGRHGLGKTREVAELARAASERGWKVLVARDEGNSRLGPAAELPPGWADATVLIVVDNIHSRVRMTNDSVTLPYMDRLDQLLRWFEARLPGSVLTVAAARDEPQFQAPLGIVPDSPTWREFSIVRLPLLTDSALERILGEFAAAATVDLDAAIVPQLVENSDKMPQTMFINVDIARRQRRGLDKAKWNPIEGETWKWRLVRAQADHPGVERVCQALRLLIEGGIPARLKYAHGSRAQWDGPRCRSSRERPSRRRAARQTSRCADSVEHRSAQRLPWQVRGVERVVVPGRQARTSDRGSGRPSERMDRRSPGVRDQRRERRGPGARRTGRLARDRPVADASGVRRSFCHPIRSRRAGRGRIRPHQRHRDWRPDRADAVSSRRAAEPLGQVRRSARRSGGGRQVGARRQRCALADGDRTLSTEALARSRD